MQHFLATLPWAAVGAGGVALLVALLLVATQRWHGHLTLDSDFGVQKFHTRPTPRIGGIAIAAGAVAGYLLTSPARQILLGPLLMAGLPAFVFGLIEDVTKRVSVSMRLLATMTSGALGWAITGLSITDANLIGLDWLLGFTVLSVAFTAFAVGGIANAVNIIDGFNGLVAGTVIIILTSFAIIATLLGDTDLAWVSLILASVMLGFAVLNWPMGGIFLGDGGAYFTGFAIAWLAVLMLARHPQVSAWAPMLVCGYPILEVGFSFVRKARRAGYHPGKPDRVHLHMLVYHRVACKLYLNASPTLQNGLTSPFMWLCALLPACWGVYFYNNTAALMLGFAMAAVLYGLLYRRLTQFRWFPLSHGRNPKPAPEAL